jgi:excisionase family DNA binding protein
MSRSSTLPEFFTTEQLAVRWAVSLETVRRRVRSGQLKATFMGRSVRYKLSDVLNYEIKASSSISPAKRPTGLRRKKQQSIARERYTNEVAPKGRRKSKKN